MHNKLHFDCKVSAKKLHESGNPGKIQYEDKVLNRYWNDPELYKRYKNCTAFINEVSTKFTHIKTDRKWDNNPIKNSNEFKQWLAKELKHPELRDCFDKSQNMYINEIKKELT